jgi:DNA-binding CsgD family transcriptional regulator
MDRAADYTIFNNFIDQYLNQGFEHISRLDPFMIDMEEKLRNNNQFFYIADLLKIKILFTSWGSQKLIGLSPEQVDTSTFFVLAHPDDQEQLNRAQTKLYKAGQELFIQQKGISIVSVLIRERNGAGDYINLLLQTYSFYSEIHNTVFTLIVATELATFKIDQGSIHYYYAGENPAMFRYPDETLLQEGYHFSGRELEILKLIAEGLGSEQIADKLFLSVNTVDTHRRNILKKTKTSNTHELVIELQETGIL